MGFPVRITTATRAQRTAIKAGLDLRRQFLLSLAPEHPLYVSPEAVAARAVAADAAK